VLQPSYLLTIFEEAVPAAEATTASGGVALVARYGICVADASTSRFCIAEFADDRSRTRLRTMLAQCPAAEVPMPHLASRVTPYHRALNSVPSACSPPSLMRDSSDV
jgi:DNA mismatch repair ATPase MutS